MDKVTIEQMLDVLKKFQKKLDDMEFMNNQIMQDFVECNDDLQNSLEILQNQQFDLQNGLLNLEQRIESIEACLFG